MDTPQGKSYNPLISICRTETGRISGRTQETQDKGEFIQSFYSHRLDSIETPQFHNVIFSPLASLILIW